ncbi:MAG TPA: choice-of-anchor tandem repeat GloVer-containing protein [Acetobacteraceae bacterium]|nr:choice-of-anchor tandem repeat GloVer-containing protein [Acetobacteraceae bacterium]
MYSEHTLFRGALLCATLSVAALTPAVGASMSRADWQRVQAATGRQVSALPHGFAAARPAATYTILHNFAGGTADGGGSTAEVTLDNSGNIYGTTGNGGTYGGGVLFTLASDGTETLLHSFGGAGDGTSPDGAVTLLASGDIYGTTQDGGSGDNGTLFELTAKGKYKVLHSFATSEGSFIRGRLVQDKAGDFFGTALFGGPSGNGSVFEYSAAGTLTVVHGFNGTDGQYPEHGVISDKAGDLFGVTAFGGANGEGAVYEISKKGKFKTLYSFTGGADGGFLYGGLAIDSSGNLYGNTVNGGINNEGTVFELSPAGKLTTLYSFKGGADGANPEGDVLLVGKTIYSTTTSGADPTCQCGGIYEVKSSGKAKTLQAFTDAEGDGYSAGLTRGGSTFYGTTAGGGANGYGVVFSLTRK